MNRNRRQSDLVGNPTLIGAVTVLIALVAIILSYNANDGLPFVPSYQITAEVRDSASLTKGNEVRIGGKRIGVVSDIRGEADPQAGATAILTLKLEKRIEPLSEDTEITIRPRSTLGLKYIELKPGRSERVIKPDGRLALKQAQPIVELDEVLNAFDAETRAGLQGVLVGLGNGIAGRGGDVNRTINTLPPFFRVFQPVAANLASSRTDLAGLISGIAATTGAVAPVSSQLGSLIDGAAVTLEAIASREGALGEVITELPPTEAVAIRVFGRVRPVLADAALLVRSARPGVRLLPNASLRLASALEAGTPVLRRATALGERLEETLRAAEVLLRNPATDGAVRKLTTVVSSLEPTLRFVNPFQVQCNYLGLWTRNAPSTVSEGDRNGTWFRFAPIENPDEIIQRATPAPNLHVNMYPDAGQNGECEAGNESYLPGQEIGNPPGNQGAFTEATAPPAGVGRP